MAMNSIRKRTPRPRDAQHASGANGRNTIDGASGWMSAPVDATQVQQIKEVLAAETREQTALAEAFSHEARRASRRLRQLRGVTDAALSHLDRADLVPTLLGRICRAMAVDSATILVFTDDRQALTPLGRRGAFEGSAVRVPVGQGLAGRIAASRKPLIVDDLTTIELVRPMLRDRLSCVAGVPLQVDGWDVGVLLVGSAAPRQFTVQDVRLLRVMGSRVAFAIAHVQLYEVARARYADAEARVNELAAIFAGMSDGVLVTDHEGRSVMSNQALRRLLALDDLPNSGKIPSHELSALMDTRDTFGEPVQATDMPAARILRGEVMQGATSLDLTIRALDGRLVEVNVTGAPVRTLEGGTVGAVTVYRDMTERRYLERQLAEQSSQLEGIFDAMADGVVVFDATGAILRENAADRAMFGFDREPDSAPCSLSERGVRLLSRDEHGNTLPWQRWPAFRVLGGETLQGDGAVDLKVRALDGRELDICESGAPIRDASGGIIGGVLIIRDVTERRNLERRTQEMLQALLSMAKEIVDPEAPEGTSATSDSSAIIRHLGDLARNVLGCEHLSIMALESETERLQPILHAGWRMSVDELRDTFGGHFRLQDLIPEAIINCLRMGEVVVIDSARIVPPGGGDWAARPMLAAPLRIGAQLIGLLGIDYGAQSHLYTEDERSLASAVAQLSAIVIERERLLREREQARMSEIASREAERRMELFMAMAGHEFKTPLTIIKGHLQRAERKLSAYQPDLASDEQLAEALRAATESLELGNYATVRMASLLNDLLQVSYAKAGKLLMRPQYCDLKSIVLDSVDDLRQTHPARNVRLRLPIRSCASVIADPERIGQVVNNYLTNAFKYSPEDQPVDVQVQVRDDTARISVRDRGPGLPKADQERIWDRFYQAAGVARQPGTDVGLGLGLYICRMIVEQHQGQVGVESAVGSGSTFWFTLPLAGISA